MKEVPPSIVLLLNRIDHYKELVKATECTAQQMCYGLVIVELEMILEEVKDR